MDVITAIIDRLLVILRAAPTYLTAVAVIAGILLDELPELGALPSWLVTGLAGIIAIVGVAGAIIRRVTPVLRDARGILPADGPATEAERELLRRLNP